MSSGAWPRGDAFEVAQLRWHVYVLACADGTLYTGICRNLERRLRQHNGEISGGASYTRGRRPVSVLWSEPSADRGAAQRREAVIKALPRSEKLRLIRQAAPEPPVA